MIKTLKGKITLVYLTLVITIGIVGICSVMNLYNLKNSIDGLMTDNYKSINASNNMAEALEKQDLVIISSIYANNQKAIDEFYKESDEFFKWYNIEANNITESGERDLVNQLGKQYLEYVKRFSQLQITRSNYDLNQAIDYYNKEVIQATMDIRKTLNDLIKVNESSMLISKDRVTNYAEDSMYIVLALSVFAVISGFVFSRYYINKTLKPISLLTNTIKRVKEGDLNQEAPVVSQDEIGIMAQEFNKMTKRLYEFERSTLGKIIQERNKTLAIVKSSSTPLIVLDTNYKILLLNDAFENFFAIEEKEVINRHFLEAVRDGEIFDYITTACKDINELNQHKEKIIKIKNKDENYYFNVVVTPVSDSVNALKISGVVVLFQDVTGLKELENMKTEFVSTVSHEFKTPLTSLMIGTSMLKDEGLGELNDKQKEIIDTINDDLNKLLSLVNDLLRLSKIEHDKSIFNMNYCNVKTIIQSSVKEFLNQAESKKIDLYYDIDKDLPQIYGDAEKLTWVINNLISNALRYTEQGDEIFIRSYKSDRKIYIYVKDSGIGIPEEYLDKVFEKFIQIKSSDGESKGTGLGLAIAKQIIEIHKGEIWCESVLGEGSEFNISLPIPDKSEGEKEYE